MQWQNCFVLVFVVAETNMSLNISTYTHVQTRTHTTLLTMLSRKSQRLSLSLA